MKRVALLPVVLCALNCFGQGQAPSTTNLFFSVPLQLRGMPAEPGPDAHPGSSPERTELEPLNVTSRVKLLNFSDDTNPKRRDETYALGSFTREFDLRMYERLDREGYFTRPELKSDAFFDRAIDNIFQPEVIRFRKTTVSCSLYTAIKRKNPLCLINPIFLNVSW
jgi:hypothetical protein